ncbi:MAG: VRR-NUC domain-containing protein [Clostridia bacterium]|nr:VRR-NUC domain-containing protein [Clostridia bacterium]
MPKNDKLEHDIQNEIRIWCGEHDLLAIRINVGLFLTLKGIPVKSGPPEGWPDLQVFDDNGHIIFVECKAKYGRAREQQKKVHAELRRRGFVVLMPHSLEEFINEMERLGY